MRAFFVVLLLLFSCLFPLYNVADVEHDVSIGVFVYPWYGSGYGDRHWNDSVWAPVVDEPCTGYYNSLNHSYWLETFQLISDAGFDFIILSYWGENSYEHNASKTAVHVLHESDLSLKFCVIYEPFNQTGESYNPYGEQLYDYRNYTATMNIIYDTFVIEHRSKYFELQGKPLLLSFNLAYPPKDDSRFTTRWMGHPPNPVDWIFWSHPLRIENGCASVIPRLDNHFLPNGTLELGVNMTQGLYERQIDAVIREYRKNPDDIEVVLFYSWNEYHERTQIEPHNDYNNDLPSTYTYNVTKNHIQTLRGVFAGKDVPNVTIEERLSLGMRYLTETQFVESLGLCKESQVNPNTIWLANDNIYTYYLFIRNGSPLANSIRDKLDEYGYWSNGKAELILNRTIDTFRTHHDYDLATEDGYTIRFENHDGEVTPVFKNYSDLCFWWSYNMLLQGNTSGAIWWWDEGFSYYNGTGFVDNSFIDEGSIHFETYKLGLCLWSAYQINYTMRGDFRRNKLSKIEWDMWRMQSPTLGGFYTHYDKNFEPNEATPNTETTCLCLIPYTMPPPTIPRDFTVVYIVILTVLAVLFMSVYLYLTKGRTSWLYSPKIIQI
jgi:hypothetical protein